MNWYYYIGVGLLFIALCILTRRVIRCLFKSGFYGKTIEIALVLFTVVAFFFSLFSGTLSEHHKDKNNDPYYWFRLQNIFEFPIEQLKNHEKVDITNKNICDTINNTILSKAEKINYIFVIDKTASNEQKVENEEWIQTIKQTLLKKFNPFVVKKLKYHSDVLSMGMLSILPKNIDYKIVLYNGSSAIYKSTKDSLQKNMPINKGNRNFEDILKDYTDKLDIEIDKSKQKTKIDDIIAIIDNDSIYNKNSLNAVFIFSDFLPDDRRWSKLNYDINKLYQKGSEKLFVNLCVLETEQVRIQQTEHIDTIEKGKIKSINYERSKDTTIEQINKSIRTVIDNQNIDNDNQTEYNKRREKEYEIINAKQKTIIEHLKTGKDIEDIEKTLSYFKGNSTYIKFYSFKQGSILGDLSDKSEEEIKTYLYSIVYTSNETTDSLCFYYPVSYGKFNKTNAVKIRFKEEGTFTLSIRNESFYKTPIALQLKQLHNKDSVINLKIDDISAKYYISDTCMYICNIQTDNMPSDIYLEMSNEQGKRRMPILFKELIPKTFCIAMIFIYTLIILLFFSCIAIFLMKFYLCIIKRYDCKSWVWIIGGCNFVIFLLLVVRACCYCHNQISDVSLSLKDTPPFLTIWWLLVLLFILILSIFVSNEIKHTDEKCNECLKKLAAKQHLDIHI